MSVPLGFDAGQTVTTAVRFDRTGRAVASGRADTDAAAPQPGWQERDPTAAWRHAAAAIASCVRAASVSVEVHTGVTAGVGPNSTLTAHR